MGEDCTGVNRINKIRIMKRRIKQFRTRGGKITGGVCSDCGKISKKFYPVSGWTFKDRVIIRDMLRLCPNCGMRFLFTKEGRKFREEWDEIKRNYLDKR